MTNYSWNSYWKKVQWEEHWQHMQTIKDWQACLLSLGINPDTAFRRIKNSADEIESFTFAINMELELWDKFSRRLELIRNNMYRQNFFHQTTNFEESEIVFRPFVKWLLSIDKVEKKAKKYFYKLLEQTEFEIAEKLNESSGIKKSTKQENAILAIIKDLSYEPTSLPIDGNGKRGVKYEVRTIALQYPKLFTHNSFIKAWERLLKEGLIKRMAPQ